MDKRNTTSWAQEHIAGSYATQEDAAARLRLAAEHCHLVGGASVCPLRIGHEIVISVVPIRMANAYPVNKTAKAIAKGNQPDPQHEDYEIPLWGVGKPDLKALAAAAGVEWTDCKRLDDGRDPHFCHFEVHGKYRQIDGSYRNFNDQRDVDLREGSPQIAGMSAFRVQGLRENMIRLGITKARLRAIRAAFGVPHSMTEEEMEKPWVFSRMIFTGEDRDPQVRRVFAAVIAQQQLAAAGALYGAAIGEPAQLLGMQPAMALSGHQAAGALPAADDEFDADGVLLDERPPPAPPAPLPPAPPQPAAAAPRAQHAAEKPAEQSNRRTGFKIPGGKEKGKDLAAASDGTLTWWLAKIETDFRDDKVEPQYREYNMKLLEAMKAELTRRTGSRQQSLDAAQPQGREPGSDG